ncbi:MAG: AmmeMemoRadiSam system radical SAM enzyme [Candidatus Omnitrophica bacterium]|nr:AmmeMemoRadiSam system radical SAM enzyme [Candidatus Omnitrophota bacterium]
MSTEEKKYIGRYWKKNKDDTIQCYLCPRHCRLRDGQRGFCFVRKNVNQELVLTTYGRSSGFCIDPIEKKPLNHFYPGTSVLSFGTAGCNLGCQFCQNWDISKSKEFDRLTERASPQAIADAARARQVQSVAFTYNDPVIFTEYAIDTAIACHAQGIKTVAVTAGYIEGEARKDFFEHMDAANIDLKSFSDDFYKRLTLSSLKPVLNTLEYVREKTATWLELTTLIIPQENDSEQEIKDLTRWIVEHLGPQTPLHFTAFHPTYKLRDKASTNAQTLQTARNIGRQNGLHYVYTGNIIDPEGSTTFCHQCQNTLIERRGYDIVAYHLDKNHQCPKCQTVCAGAFDSSPGSWGNKRQSVRF